MDNYSTSNKHVIFALIVFAIVGIGFFYIFYDSLWVWFNILASFAVGLFAALGVFCFGEQSYSESSKMAGGFGSFLFAFILAYSLHSCFYVSPQERILRIEQQEASKKQQEKEAQEARERAIKLEEEENSKFKASGQDVMVFGAVNREHYALGMAKIALKNFAKNPKSIDDITALSQPVRIRIKQYPQCRYALKVQFMAQNSFGATGRHTAVVLFNSDWEGFAVLENAPF